jgi:hypothetical protein
MAKKEHPFTEWDSEKILENTGSKEKPFFALVNNIKRLRIFGVLVFRANLKSTFPTDGGK